MKLYTRKDFIKLPKMTIYSRIPNHFGLLEGLFCKMSDSNEYKNDFVEQDLISECGYPNKISDGMEALMFQINLRDSFKDFKTDLFCAGRDGTFDDEDKFIVWDKKDILNLRNYLNNVLNQK